MLPQSLKQAVWPFVEEWLIWFNTVIASNRMKNSYVLPSICCNCQKMDANTDIKAKADYQDLVAQGFLWLLK